MTASTKFLVSFSFAFAMTVLQLKIIIIVDEMVVRFNGDNASRVLSASRTSAAASAAVCRYSCGVQIIIVVVLLLLVRNTKL